MTEPGQVHKVLEMCLRASRLTQGQVEERLGVSRGYLWRLRTGRVQLTAKRLLEVLDIVDVPPLEFARAAFPSRDRASHPLLQALIRERPEVHAVLPAPRDLRKEMEELREALSRALTGGEEPPGS